MKWINAIDIGPSASGKTNVWRITDLFGGVTLGLVKWHGPWRKYAFFPHPNTLFEATCLLDLATFCDSVTTAHRLKLKESKT